MDKSLLKASALYLWLTFMSFTDCHIPAYRVSMLLSLHKGGYRNTGSLSFVFLEPEIPIDYCVNGSPYKAFGIMVKRICHCYSSSKMDSLVKDKNGIKHVGSIH